MVKQISSILSRNSRVSFFIDNWQQISIIFCLVILISFLFPRGEVLQYSYKLNDITREPIIAPFTFPILKNQNDYEKDKEIEKKSVPFIFNRKKNIVDNQLAGIDDFFKSINDLRSARYRYNESKQLYYERKYHLTAEKAKNEFIADSTSLSIVLESFRSKYPFTTSKDSSWKNYIDVDTDPRKMKDWIFHKNIVSQISKNRWSEGIYDISMDSIISDRVKINQGQVPIIVKKQDFNSLEVAWIKAKEEYNDKISLEDSFSDIGYDIIVEFMTPNLLFDRKLTLSNQRLSIKQVPRSKGVVLERELIVDANIRITEDVLTKIEFLNNRN